MNTKLRKAAKINFEKDIFKVMNNLVCGKTSENVQKHRDIKLITKERRRKCLMSEPGYHSTKFFTESLLTIEIRKNQILMNKAACLGILILDLSKTVIYEFWHDYVKPKYGEKVRLE